MAVAHGWIEDPNGELGLPFFAGNGFYTGTGIHQQKTIENGNGIKIWAR